MNKVINNHHQSTDVIRFILQQDAVLYTPRGLMNTDQTNAHPPVCDYEGSDYQASFWEQGEREYEDQVEAVALRRLLPSGGNLLLEVGAGAGRNTSRYTGFKQIVLVDYSLTQLQQAQERLGRSERYIYVAADAYRLPFQVGLFDTATMIRVLHHMAEPELALDQVQRVLSPGGVFILEYANKQNLKAILRYVLHRQSWSPFSLEAVEFTKLNYDFHPKAVQSWLQSAGFVLERQLTVSHFRLALLKRLVPVRWLVWLDSLVQHTGNWWQLTPSVFTRSHRENEPAYPTARGFFQCPECSTGLNQPQTDYLTCSGCGRVWAIRDGIYDFRKPD